MKKLLKLVLDIVFLAFVVIAGVTGYTHATFSDSEKISNVSFTAGTLDFSLTNPSNVPITNLFSVSDLEPGDVQSMSARVKKEGSLNFKYNITVSQTDGDSSFCNALKIKASADGDEKYNGNLIGMNFDAVTLSETSDDWDFDLSYEDDENEFVGKSCSFSLTYKGWQTNGISTTGFFDTEVLGNDVAAITSSEAEAGDVVINEVMWMGSIGGPSGDDEWIELRNTTDSPIDLSNWFIQNAGLDGNAIDIPSGTIPANGYFLITKKEISESEIDDLITSNLVISGMSLHNDGEELILKNSSEHEIDSTPEGEWPAGGNGATRHSMERNDDPADGWHMCSDDACNDGNFWDTAYGSNYGTPAAENLSDETITKLPENLMSLNDSEVEEKLKEETSEDPSQPTDPEKGSEGEKEESQDSKGQDNKSNPGETEIDDEVPNEEIKEDIKEDQKPENSDGSEQTSDQNPKEVEDSKGEPQDNGNNPDGNQGQSGDGSQQIVLNWKKYILYA